MISIVETLQADPEPYPRWLQNPLPNFDLFDFFGSRTVYYPGSYIDGQPIELSSLAHFAHAFVYVDYGISLEGIRNRVHRVGNYVGFRGYDEEHSEIVEELSLWPGGWNQNINPHELLDRRRSFAAVERFAWFVVLKRDDNFDKNHGPERLAILFIGADGHTTYKSLYCQPEAPPAPYLVVIQDHGWAGNYSSFGEGGSLSKIAHRCNVLPEWLLVGEPSKVWRGYYDIGAEPQPGGMYDRPRRLFLREDSPIFERNYRRTLRD